MLTLIFIENEMGGVHIGDGHFYIKSTIDELCERNGMEFSQSHKENFISYFSEFNWSTLK